MCLCDEMQSAGGTNSSVSTSEVTRNKKKIQTRMTVDGDGLITNLPIDIRFEGQ